MKKVNFSYLIVFVVLFTSCAVRKPSTGDGSATVLLNKKWQLVELNGKVVPATVNGKMPFLEFLAEEGRYGASGGCNGIGGEYTLVKKNGIKFKRGMSTMMACEDMSIEHGLGQLFEQADTYQVEGNQLTLSKGKGEALAKFNLVEDGAGKLSGTWEVDYILEPGTTFETLYPERKPTITFDSATNRVTGNSSCNNFSSSISVKGHQIKFGPAAATKMACPGNGEQVFFKNLERVTSFDMQENTLTMIADDIVVMRWSKK
ncbi:META domain-containing protein [Sphingobacterium suaedae]|uniref:META domain-containing protein n=1 Tax=Sphingobacterium suaedae TaxID=1686402 RepID=A0ABW5KKV5_9SPHI